nr:unnamed protein product [Digitaria exilis]
MQAGAAVCMVRGGVQRLLQGKDLSISSPDQACWQVEGSEQYNTAQQTT